MKNSFASQSGFSLVEQLVSVAVGGVAVIAIASMFGFVGNQTGQAGLAKELTDRRREVLKYFQNDIILNESFEPDNRFDCLDPSNSLDCDDTVAFTFNLLKNDSTGNPQILINSLDPDEGIGFDGSRCTGFTTANINCPLKIVTRATFQCVAANDCETLLLEANIEQNQNLTPAQLSRFPTGVANYRVQYRKSIRSFVPLGGGVPGPGGPPIAPPTGMFNPASFLPTPEAAYGSHKIAATNSTMIFMKGGQVQRWGATQGNRYPPLPAPSSMVEMTPQYLQRQGGGNLTGVIDIDAGSSNACAIVNPGGQVWCWGNGPEGALGNGPPLVGDSQVAVQVEISPGVPLTNVVDLAMASHSGVIALVDDGNPGGKKMYFWGPNFGGRALHPTYNTYGPGGCIGSFRGNSDQPHNSPPLGPRDTVDGDGRGNCGILSRATEITGMNANADQPAAGAPYVAQVEIGSDHVCVLFSNGTAKCWGANQFAQLGLGSGHSTTEDVPAQFLSAALSAAMPGGIDKTTGLVQAPGGGDLTGILQLYSDDYGGMCARLDDTQNHRAVCWGANFWGQLGIGSETPLGLGAQPASSDTFNARWPYEGGVGGANPAFMRDSSGAILENIVSIEKGRYVSCARLSTGNIHCFGKKYDGFLGYNASSETIGYYGAAHSQVTNLPAASIMSWDSSTHSTCAYLDNDDIWCWGSNGYGNLGSAKPTSADTEKCGPILMTGILP